MSRIAAILAVCGVALAAASSGAASSTASAGSVAAKGPAALPAVVAATFPLGVTGLTANPDGSRTLWVLSTQGRRVRVGGESIFRIVDVVFRGAPGYKLKVRGGENCSVTSQTSEGTLIECLPIVEPKQLVSVLTFTSSRPYPAAASPTVELNSSSEITVAANLPVPASKNARTAASAALTAFAGRYHLISTVVDVTAGQPTEDHFTLSARSVPRGWVTFIVTNRGKKSHSFELCPNGGLLNMCLASSSAGSFAQESDQTGALLPGQSAYFSVHLPTPGSYEYLSEIPGQAADGAKADLKVT